MCRTNPYSHNTEYKNLDLGILNYVADGVVMEKR